MWFLVGLLTLIYFIFAGLAPALFIQAHYVHGSTFVSLYSHLYRYPVFFGWITIPLLAYPVKYLLSVKNLSLPKFKTLICLGLIAMATLFVIADVNSDNIAPFEVKAEVLQNDERLKDHFTKASPNADEKQSYQNRMLELIKNRSNWSIARLLHYIAIFLQVLNLLAIGFIATGLTIHRTLPQGNDSAEFKLALIYCFLAGLVSYLWGLMRAAFNYQKPVYFPEISNPVTEIWIAASFIIVTLVIVIGLNFWVGSRLSNLISALVGFAGAVGVFTVTKFRDLLLAVFGKDAGTVPYWTILLGMAVVSIFIFLGHKIRANPTE
jgi:hypothetical protein